jgi:LPXTG-site transpeptidase (sortase) family protein
MTKRARRHVAVLAGALILLAGAAVVTKGALSQQAVPPTAPKVLEPSVSEQPKAVSALKPSRPSRILIPAIGVSAPFVRLGLKPSGELDTPTDPDTVGWYTKSPAPGVLGPSIVAGHVTWNRKPSVFFRLGSIRPGDQVRIRRVDGVTAIFAVTKIATYPKDQFPTDEVYGNVDHAELRLITCGGEYVESRHRYLDNVVVYARLTKSMAVNS